MLERFLGEGRTFLGGEMITLLDHYGIDVSVAFGMAKPTSDYAENNEAILSAAREHPGRIVPFARMNPHVEGRGPELVERWVAAGARGLKFHPFWDAFQANDPYLVHPILEAADPHGLIVLFHSGESWLTLPGLVYDLALTFRNTRFIIGHSGLYGFDAEAMALTKRIDNVWLDTTELWPPERIRTIVNAVGKERLLLGTDAPYINAGAEIEKVLRFSRLNDEELEAVLGRNLAELLSLDIQTAARSATVVDYPIAEPQWRSASASAAERASPVAAAVTTAAR